MDSIVQAIAVYAIPVIFAITLHEAAHGFVARRFGDATAWMLGRVTLNPIKHIDPIGTIAVPAVLLLLGKLFGGGFFLFGWAKPVPVNFENLRNPKRDMIWVSAAGPGANLAMALLWALFFKILMVTGVEERYFYLVAQAGLTVNLMFMALNLIPIPPLDGGRILIGVLPRAASNTVARLEPYGIFVVFALLATGLLSSLLLPPVSFAFGAIATLFGLR